MIRYMIRVMALAAMAALSIEAYGQPVIDVTAPAISPPPAPPQWCASWLRDHRDVARKHAADLSARVAEDIRNAHAEFDKAKAKFEEWKVEAEKAKAILSDQIDMLKGELAAIMAKFV